MSLNLLLAFSVIYIGSKSREIEKNNDNLISNLSKINENIKINKIELTTHHNTSYLKSLHSLYFSEIKENKLPKVLSLKQLLDKKNNVKLVNINK